MKVIINIDVPALESAIAFYTAALGVTHARTLDDDVATARAIAAGAIQESGYVDWRGSRCVSFSDPFGHGFCGLNPMAAGQSLASARRVAKCR